MRNCIGELLGELARFDTDDDDDSQLTSRHALGKTYDYGKSCLVSLKQVE